MQNVLFIGRLTDINGRQGVIIVVDLFKFKMNDFLF